MTQRSYAWSYSYAEDFVLFDYSIRNIRQTTTEPSVHGHLCRCGHSHDRQPRRLGAQDDLAGFREWQPALYLPAYCPPDSDIVNLAWTADNDGDLDRSGSIPVPAVTATRIVRTPSEQLDVSFNWWFRNAGAHDFGPQKKETSVNRDGRTGHAGR